MLSDVFSGHGHPVGRHLSKDAIQALGGVRQLQAAVSTTLVWDYQRKSGVIASVPTAVPFAGPNAPRLNQFEPEADHAYTNEADAQRAMTLAQQALEARHKTWLGRSTVRTLEAGRQVPSTQSTLDVLASLGNKNPNTSSSARQRGAAQDQTRFVLTAVIHAGINNLPKDLSPRIHPTLGGDRSGKRCLPPWISMKSIVMQITWAHTSFRTGHAQEKSLTN